MKLLNLFRRSDYQSEITQFIHQLQADKPTLEAEQSAGRALLWEQTVSREAQADNRATRVAQKAYVYSAS
jgi:Protein of unknown function (DUF3460)